MKRANLCNGNLTIEQLATVGNLNYTIMPDGSLYEEWEPLIPPYNPNPIQEPTPPPNNASGKNTERTWLLLAGAGIAVLSSMFTLLAYGRWGNGRNQEENK